MKISIKNSLYAVRYLRLFFFVFYLFIVNDLGAIGYIKLNEKDCAKCSITFSAIAGLSNVDTVYVLVREELKREQRALKKNLGLNNFTKFNYIFNDSLYEYFRNQSTTISSELFIVRNDKIVFSSALEPAALENIKYQLLLDNQTSICPNPEVENSQSLLLHFGSFAVTQDSYNNISVFNLLQNKQYMISFEDTANLSFVYKKLYKEDFTARYPFIRDYISDHPRFKPSTYQSFILLEGEKLFVSYNVWDYKIENNFSDTTLFQTSIIGLYDLTKQEFINVFLPDPSSAFTDGNLSRIFVSESRLIGQFYTPQRKNRSAIYQLRMDAKKGLYSATNVVLKDPFPMNYYGHVPSHMSISFTPSNHTILYSKADSIYSTYHNKMIRIPYLSNHSGNSKIINDMNIYDRRSDLFYLVYYLEGKVNILYYISFDANGNRKKMRAFKNEKNGPADFLNPYEWIQFNNKKRCFEVISIAE